MPRTANERSALTRFDAVSARSAQVLRSLGGHQSYGIHTTHSQHDPLPSKYTATVESVPATVRDSWVTHRNLDIQDAASSCRVRIEVSSHVALKDVGDGI